MHASEFGAVREDGADSNPLTLGQVIKRATRALGPGEAARLEAEILLAHALACGRAALRARPEMILEAAPRARFEILLERRLAGEPVAYITGQREFWSRTLYVNRDVIIPRPETEHLVEAALEHIPPAAHRRVADLGTGSGAIAIALAGERPGATVLATDVSLSALAVARRNVAAAKLRNVTLLAASWLDPFTVGGLDVVVCNPPYLADNDPHLAAGDLRFEPHAALAAGADGLDAVRAVAAGARRHLVAGGALLLEHGFDQGVEVRRLLRTLGYRKVFGLEDYAGRERVSGASWPG